MAKNLQSGFEKCGIVPCDKEPLLQRLPEKRADEEAVSAAFFDVLQNTRIACTGSENIMRKRRRKIDVPAGKSVAHEEIVQQEKAPLTKRKTLKQQKRDKNYSESDDEQVHDVIDHDSSDEENWESYRQKQLEANDEQEEILEQGEPSFQPVNRQVGAFVIIRYESNYYPGVIESFNDEGAKVSAMIKSLKSWKWPAQSDTLFYEWKDVIGGIDPPKRLNKRGLFRVPELENKF